MAEKNFNTRIVHKHDIEANWQLAVNFTPKQGELIVYDPDENFSYPRIKIGDGEKNVNDLPFITDNVEIGEGGEIIYKQPEEPENAPVGSLWVDLDEYAGGQLFKQPEEPSTATEGDLWVDTDAEDGGLPGLTNEDNGKILLAQNGQWEVSNNSWNDLNNKPIIYGNTLEWDGDITGLESIQHEYGYYLYKVSNLVISEEELEGLNNKIAICDSERNMNIRPHLEKTELGIELSSVVIFTSNGIYFGKDLDSTTPDVYIASITIPGRQDLPRRKLNEEMLPEYVRNLKGKEEVYFDKISTEGNSLDWDGNTEGLSVDHIWNNLYKISDITPSYEDLQKGGTITFNNQGKVEKTISFPRGVTDIMERPDGYSGYLIDLGVYCIIATMEENDRGREPGLYAIKDSDFYISNITFNDYTEKKVIKKEFLPAITWEEIQNKPMGEGYVDNLAAKYLPNEAPTITEINYSFVSSGVPFNYIKTSDDILTYENFVNGFEVTVNQLGQVQTVAFDISKIIETEDYITDGDNISTIATFRIYKENNSVGAESGTYLLHSGVESSTFVITMNLMVPQSFRGIKTLDVSYLPKNFILPEVTNENEGQILRVVNGVWTLVDFPTS